jgi:chromosomal replication initiation ATPase DnaA
MSKDLNTRKITSVCAAVWGVTDEEVLGRGRSHREFHPRAAAVHIARTTLKLSYGQIGRAINGRDPSTIGSAFERAEKYLREDPDFSEMYDRAIDMCRNAPMFQRHKASKEARR